MPPRPRPTDTDAGTDTDATPPVAYVDGGDVDDVAPAAPGVGDETELVEARWIDDQTVYLPIDGRIIGPGDTFVTSTARIAADTRLIRADQPWTPAEPADTKE
jgi:hypothetical protein